MEVSRQEVIIISSRDYPLLYQHNIMALQQNINIQTKNKIIVGCLTFNHSKYIVDALNGFAMQETDFPFTCIIMDDASTDGEPEIINDWLQQNCDLHRADYYDLDLAKVVLVPHRINTNCTMAVYFLKRNLYHEIELKFSLFQEWLQSAEYFAECEGDDYWIDSSKLQKQADCLDNHPEIDCCIHGNIIKKDSTHIINTYKNEECIISLEDNILRNKFVPAASSIFIRCSILFQMLRYFSICPIDYTVIITGALRGGVYYLPQIMSCYRKNVKNSIYSQIRIDSKFRNKYFEKKICMLNALNEDLKYEYQRVIHASILHASLHFDSPRHIIKNIFFYRDGFHLLPIYYIFLLLAKCALSNEIGKKVLNIMRRLH